MQKSFMGSNFVAKFEPFKNSVITSKTPAARHLKYVRPYTLAWGLNERSGFVPGITEEVRVSGFGIDTRCLVIIFSPGKDSLAPPGTVSNSCARFG